MITPGRHRPLVQDGWNESNWRTRHKVHFGPRIFTVPKTAFSGPCTASLAMSSRYCSDGTGWRRRSKRM